MGESIGKVSKRVCLEKDSLIGQKRRIIIIPAIRIDKIPDTQFVYHLLTDDQIICETLKDKM